MVPKKNIEVDVLVVGTGGAGLRAAIEAHNAGAKVLVISKGDFPSGCTAISMGGMLAAFDEKDSSDLHFKDTIEGGSNLNDQNLVKILVDKACDRALDLERYGTNFDKKGEDFKLFPYTGSTVARGVLADDHYRGGYVKGLTKEVQKLGIEVLEHAMVADLLQVNGVVAGALVLETQENRCLVVSAASVVLATGGAGELYRLTTNPSGMTGDGYALALQAGAQLSDMEFIQGRVCMINPEGMRGTPPPGDGLVTLGGRFYNSRCERYMRKYFPEKLELVTRAQMSMCAQKEIQAGLGTQNGGVFGDLSGVPHDDLTQFKKFMETCAAENFDPSYQPYEWAPGTHHFMGGVIINEICETGVDGLYAAGEVAAGVHGANRLAGNALTETQVFGAIAGEQAAKRASTIKRVSLPEETVSAALSRVDDIMRRDSGVDQAELKAQLTDAMSKYVGVIRNEEGMLKAAEVIEDIKKTKVDQLLAVNDKSLQGVAAVLEVKNLVVIGNMVVTAALMRTETRGSHNREEFPESDDKWLKHIIFNQQNGEEIIQTKPVETI